MSDEWRDTFAAARAQGDQNLAALRDLEDPVRAFMHACTVFAAELELGGIPPKQLTTTMVTLALGAAISE